MKDTMFYNFAAYFPSFAKNTISYEAGDSLTLVVKLANGASYLYDDLRRCIRRLPDDSNRMSESECRKEFGFRLMEMMSRRSMTQVELAEITGIQQRAISNYVNGKVTPSFYNADKIAKALKCSLDDLRYSE